MIFGYPLDLYFGITVGFFATVVAASAIDKFGDAMFARGVAQPFFVGKYRLHHRSILYRAVPAGYLAIAAMVVTGLVKIRWGLIWTGLEGTAVVVAACLFLDMAVDYLSRNKGVGPLRHELVYLAVPLFAFSAFLRFTV